MKKAPGILFLAVWRPGRVDLENKPLAVIQGYHSDSLYLSVFRRCWRWQDKLQTNIQTAWLG